MFSKSRLTAIVLGALVFVIAFWRESRAEELIDGDGFLLFTIAIVFLCVGIFGHRLDTVASNADGTTRHPSRGGSVRSNSSDEFIPGVVVGAVLFTDSDKDEEQSDQSKAEISSDCSPDFED